MPRPKENRIVNPIGKRIRELLANAPMTTQELMAALGCSQPTISRYIKALEESELVQRIGYKDSQYLYGIGEPEQIVMTRLSNGDKHAFDKFWGWWIEHSDTEPSYLQFARALPNWMMLPALVYPSIVDGTFDPQQLVNAQKTLQQIRLEFLKVVTLIDSALDDPRLWNPDSIVGMAPHFSYTKSELEAIALKAFPPKVEYRDPNPGDGQ